MIPLPPQKIILVPPPNSGPLEQRPLFWGPKSGRCTQVLGGIQIIRDTFFALLDPPRDIFNQPLLVKLPIKIIV